MEELSTTALQELLAHSLDTHSMVCSCYCYIVGLKTVLETDAEVQVLETFLRLWKKSRNLILNNRVPP